MSLFFSHRISKKKKKNFSFNNTTHKKLMSKYFNVIFIQFKIDERQTLHNCIYLFAFPRVFLDRKFVKSVISSLQKSNGFYQKKKKKFYIRKKIIFNFDETKAKRKVKQGIKSKNNYIVGGRV